MFGQIVAFAMLSPGRQRAFRQAVVIHGLLLLAGMTAVDFWPARGGLTFLGQLLLVGGIVEGALLVGWRLTQLPKSLSLEFLLVTPQLPRGVFLAEAIAGLGRLALVTLSGLPALLLLVIQGQLLPLDLVTLLVMPCTWGAITGLGLTVWAYEPLRVRRVGEKLILLGILFYLGVGVLIGEHLFAFLRWLPDWLARSLSFGFHAFHELNPFAIMRTWLLTNRETLIPPIVVEERTLGLEVAALVAVGLLLARGASRLKGHFHERHYKPILDPTDPNRGQIGNRPLTWWAVKRVTEYAGRANLWLAGSFGFLYAAYTVANAYSCWPPWLGKVVFEIFDQMGGIPALSTALVVLAAVPAAWQYGLWDSNTQDRVRRLELLLLTELEARDYWEAAAAAAWHRGRGYFGVAVLLWLAACWAGKITVWQVTAAVAAAVLLWTLYFSLGFRAFSRGIQANGLGSFLALGLPALTYALGVAGWPFGMQLVPPGSVYAAVLAQPPNRAWALGPLLLGSVTLSVARVGLQRCDRELRQWYDRNHGSKVME